ncbi:MAG TPA: hypothetical protein VJS12_22770 [Steroidobacteraceae bacterium]|nr:hypothetical protein [Steroidobacteraceae bacterium]
MIRNCVYLVVLSLLGAARASCAADSVDLALLSPPQLLEVLEGRNTEGGMAFVAASRRGWVKEEHLPALMELLDSPTECLPVMHEKSSTIPRRSTIGQEAAFMVEGYRAGTYPPAPIAEKSRVTKEELRDWWAGPHCPLVGAINTIPFRGERGADAAYDRLRFDDACERVLFDSLDDAQRMPDPRQMPPEHRFTVADAALFILLQRRSIDVDQLLPPDVAARMQERGIEAYFDYVATPSGRSAIVDRVRYQFAQ